MQTRQELVLSFMHSLAANPSFADRIFGSNQGPDYAKHIWAVANQLTDEFYEHML